MTVISGEELFNLVDHGVVSSTVDEDVQLQMCGVELTLKQVEGFASSGVLDFDNSERKVAETYMMEFDESNWIHLPAGAYLVTFNEIVSIPPDKTALARPRSSLLRMGATLSTALWDPGYRGRSQSLLQVLNPHGLKLKRNARLLQLVFFDLSSIAKKMYSGVYQGENV